jgi:hypothetical protein
MSVSLPHPSSRLLRAAAAEQGDLARHRDRLTDRREALLAELRQLDDALTVVDDRLSMLERLTGPPAQADAVDDAHASRRSESVAAARRDGAQTRDPATEVLRGPAIRETAVRVVIGQPQRIEALHYRRWYDLLQ